MISKQYGVYSVMGNFGSGKTFGTFLEISQLNKEENFIIANVPYKFVDLFYSKPQDLYSIIECLEHWVYQTNYDVYRYYLRKSQFKNIVIVIDEAHLYFNARKRDKGGLMERLDILMTQCRKRNIKIFFISQRLKRVDINIRRMTDFVVRYKRRSIPILGIQRSMRSVYENEGDLADIQGDDSKTYVMNKDSNSFGTDIEKSKLESSLFMPLLKIFRLPIGKRLSQGQFKNFEGEAHNSYFISGLEANGTKTSFGENDLYIEEKPLTDKEEKIKKRIHKNLPFLVKIFGAKKTQNAEVYPISISKKNSLYLKDLENGSNSGETIASDKRSDTGNATDSIQSEDNNNNDGLRNGSLGDYKHNVNPPKRIASFRELREFEDRISDGANVIGSSSINDRTKRKFARALKNN